MENLSKVYKKFRWFYTSSGKLVVGGKNAEQNDVLLFLLKHSRKEYVVMHTAEPGSPFSIIVSETSKVTKQDMEECAIFTGCFSRAWKLGKKQAVVDIFRASELQKEKTMKTGTWGVLGKVERRKVSLALVLTRQEKILRAVPEQTAENKKNIIFKIIPGKISKEDILAKIGTEFGSLNKEELLSALPAGGLKIIK